MKILWADFAISMMSEIIRYHKEVAGQKTANTIKANIFSTTRQLIRFPESGQIEPTLKPLNEDHRYLLSGNYKIIYRRIPEGVLITDIFDTRQDPTKINP